MGMDAAATAAWVQAIGSVAAIAAAVWSANKASRLALRQLERAEALNAREAAAARLLVRERQLTVTEVTLAAAIRVQVAVQEDHKRLSTSEGRAKALEEMGAPRWLETLDARTRLLAAIPPIELPHNTAAIAADTLLFLANGWREKAEILLQREGMQFDCGDVLGGSDLLMQMLQTEVERLVGVRDWVRSERDAESVRAGATSPDRGRVG